MTFTDFELYLLYLFLIKHIVSKPIKKEIVKKVPNKPWTEKVKCEVCNKEYSRSGVTSHRGTKLHQYKLSMSQKFIGLLDKNVDKLNADKRKIII